MVRFEGKCTKIKFLGSYDENQSQKQSMVQKLLKCMEDLYLLVNKNIAYHFFFKKDLSEVVIRIYRKSNFPPRRPYIFSKTFEQI